MAENANGAEKTELPTPRRLSEARSDGQVSFSAELNTSVLLLLGFCLLAIMGPWLWDASAASLRWACGEGLRIDLNDRGAMRSLLTSVAPLVWWLVPFLGILFAGGVAISVAQVGWHPTLKPLLPKMSRLNPITGIGRLFGVRGLMRFAINLLKLGLILAVAYVMLSSSIPREAYLTREVGVRSAQEAERMIHLGIVLASVLAIIGFIDFMYQRWQHTRDLMMTKQELREEYKNSEGDPLLKGRIRQIQRQMAQRRMMKEVPKADVVITNPTHVAVAIRYDRDEMAAPVVVAKGYDAIAQRIKEIARVNGVTMVENVPLARALAKEVEIGHPVPVKWYQAVAEVLAMVYKVRKAKKVA